MAFPTETVYGLGANALDPMAVTKIFIEKERPTFDPLIVHIADSNQLKELALDVDDRVMALTSEFWPGPLTIVLNKRSIIPDIVTSGLPTVGIRMPDNQIALELIRESGCPIAAPSANKFGKISPTTAAHVEKQNMNLECILDGGPTTVGIESTVIALNEDGYIILREGFITSEQLSLVVPQSTVKEHSSPLASPGLLKSHYSPSKPLYLIEPGTLYSNTLLDRLNPQKMGYLSFSRRDLKDVAVNLFQELHNLEDDPNIEYIVAETVPETGIGRAIMDRLRKASYQYSKSSQS